jgi:diguanylate cyclase (GGDEF)-like protein
MDNSWVTIEKVDILIVDDTAENIRLLSTMLSKKGYNVRKAINGQMALTAVKALPPDLILLDIMMPEMDGYEVCQCLKANPQTASTPVIFLSALDDAFDKVRAFEVGGADYITKPFQFEEVLARVRHQLALKTAGQHILRLNSELEERVKERTQQLEIANAQLLEMALHDALTRLANRALFMELLSQSLERAKAEAGYQFAVLFLDCDRFKVINDSLGHMVGDELLVAIAHRLQATLNPGDTLARLGGDEFAVLLTEITHDKQACDVAHDLLKALNCAFQLKRHEVFINASIGVVIGNSRYSAPEHILRDADTAMYSAKAAGKAQYRLFDATMHDAAMEFLQLENDLRRAINRQEFMLQYQPIVNLQTGQIAALEALLRWYHPSKGYISPVTFIPVAEETGLINAIGHWVLQEACQQLQTWQKQGIAETLSISVNLSVRQFAQPNLISQIDQILSNSNLEPQRLKLEITETALMDNAGTAATILKQLRERRIELSIDDFGTGYSSLSYLHSFPVDTLKVDRSFVSCLDGKLNHPKLILMIINVAQALGMKVVAEGIETQRQLDYLRELNCEFGQGYLFAKPLPASQIEALIKSNPQW